NQQRAPLYKLMPTLLDQPRARFMLTTHGYDLDTPGASPQVIGPPYQLQTGKRYPNQDVTSTYTQPTAPFAPTPGSDSIPNDGRTAVLPRIDLNRKLTPYYDQNGQFLPPSGPPPMAGTPLALPAQQYYQALQDRQNFAREIFDRLVLATGARPLTGTTPPTFG